jgi:hypothetical protein
MASTKGGEGGEREDGGDVGVDAKSIDGGAGGDDGADGKTATHSNCRSQR